MATKIDDEDIRDAIEAELERMANQEAAVSHSLPDDQIAIDLDEKGYDDQSAFYLAWFGDEFAVDGDILVRPQWYDLLGLKKSKTGVQTWREAATKDRKRADLALVDLAEGNGYEYIRQLSGDWPTGDEAEIPVEGMIGTIHQKTGAPKKRILRVFSKSFASVYDSRNDLVYWRSSPGKIAIYAKSREEKERAENPRGCAKGELLISRGAYKREGSTVAAATYCAPDRGKPGRGQRIVPGLRENKLGGPGYLKKSATARRKELDKCTKTYGYRSCLQSLQYLLLVGGEYSGAYATWSRTALDKVKADKRWLTAKYGGAGSFGSRKPNPRHVRLARNLSW